MEYVHHKEERNGYTLKVIADPDPTNPREDFDEASTMVCEHRRYELGDKDGRDTAIEAVRASRDYRPSWEDRDNYGANARFNFDEPNELFEALTLCSDIVYGRLYLYDHSGITIRMSRGGNPFHCPWDSGMVGFIFMTKADILKNWMLPATSRLTPALKEKALDLMEGETKTYDMYLTGDVWGYVIEDEDGEHVDSLWGIFDSDEAVSEGQSALEHFASIEPQLPLEELAGA